MIIWLQAIPNWINAWPNWVQAIAAILQFFATAGLLIATLKYVKKTKVIADTAEAQLKEQIKLRDQKLQVIKLLMLRGRTIAAPGMDEINTTADELSQMTKPSIDDIYWPLATLMAEGIVKVDERGNFILPRHHE